MNPYRTRSGMKHSTRSRRKKMKSSVTGNCEVNPLLIPHVIKNVLDHLPVSDLKNFRLVSHDWDKEAQKVIRGRAGMLVKFEGGETERLRRFIHFLSTYAIASSFPFPKFGVHSDKDRQYQTSLSRFFGVVASWITHLELKSDLHQLLASRKWEKLTFPRLRSFHWTVRNENLTNFNIVQHIIVHSSNLESVGFNIPSYQTFNFEHLINISYDKIRHFQFRGGLADYHLVSFLERGMNQLQSLELEVANASFILFGGRPLTAEVFKRLLERQSAKLQILKINLECVMFPFSLELPELPKLTSLEIKDQAQSNPLHMVALTFSRHLPALKTLTVSERMSYNLSVFAGQTAEGVEEFEVVPYKEHRFEEPQPKFDEHALASIAQAFPNLRKLGVPARPMIMKAIQVAKDTKSMFQHLEQLTLFTEGQVDSALDLTLTGSGLEDEEALEFLLTVTSAQDEGGSILSPRSLRLFRRMTVLKVPKFFHELKFLVIKPIDHNLPWHLNLSCYFVLLSLRKLKQLDLRGYESEGSLKISLPAWQKLCEKVEVLHDPKALVEM